MGSIHRFGTFGVALWVLSASALSMGQDCEPIEVAKLIASDGERWNSFGDSLALSGHTAIVASRFHEKHGNFGAAWVYRFDGVQWIEEAELFEPGTGDDDRYGESAALSGDFAFVGRPGGHGNDSRSGTVHVYHFTGVDWIHEGQLFATDGQGGDSFGRSIHASGGLFVVGADGDEDNGRDSGSAYIFRYDGSAWVQETKLLPNAGAAGDRFGSAISVADDRVVVGAPRNRDQGDNAGTAYVFAFDGQNWIEEAKLIAPDGSEFDQFGDEVAISGRTIVIGAEDDGPKGFHSGSAYVFQHDGNSWLAQAKLVPLDGAREDRFGTSTAVAGNVILIGASGADGSNSASGAAYIFRLDGANWVEDTKLIASDSGEGDIFGRAVALSGNTALISAPEHDKPNGNSEGSAYVFDLNCASSDCLNLTVENLIAGKTATFNITKGTPNTKAVTVYGTNPGTTKVNNIAGYCANFGIKGVNQNRVIGGLNRTFNNNGEITFNLNIPANLAGFHVLFQSAQRSTCPDECTSNLIDTTIQ